MRFSFCPDCGERLIQKEIGDEGETPYCAACERPWFGFSYPCVICLAVNEAGETVLLRQDYISTQHRVLVSGYIKSGESAENAAAREVLEETGLPVINARYVLSRHFARSDCLMLGFICEVKKGELSPSSEVDEADWFPADKAKSLLRSGSIGAELLELYLGSR